MTIAELYKNPAAVDTTVRGWVRSVRASKTLAFVELADGSGIRGVQLVVPDTLSNFTRIAKLNVGAAIVAAGTVVLTPESRQPFEIATRSIEVEGDSAPDYPLQKKRHSLEFLRSITALRPRTNTFQAVFRVRSEVSFAIHDFFHSCGFVYVHTPLITSSDAEGAGELFRVTTSDSAEFFGVPTSLTVSGQLEGESFAQAFSNIYTFGPTFRAENSNTPRHAAEFWMVEPEMAFCDLSGDMDVAEAMVKHILRHVLSICEPELEFLNNFVDKGLLERLNSVANATFARISYTTAIEELEKVRDRFQYPVAWGADLQTEHERYLAEELIGDPVFVTDYPKQIKAFYMRQNDDGKTVAAADLLVPGVGELIGGSQREERLERLTARMSEMNIDPEAYEGYLSLRKYGTTRHAGFGLGLERMVMYATGMANIRDVIPYPRTAGSLL
ncbi:asparagine--tRNA ligase [Clostridia bacterium]|nr:asparagine--tRNA ligase [Clostridia bacterium]